MRIPTLLFLPGLGPGATSCTEADRGPTDRPEPRFTRLPSSQTGVAFENPLQEDRSGNGLSYEYYFDRDGDIDIVAGYVGLNLPYVPTPDAPVELYVHDFSESGWDAIVPGVGVVPVRAVSGSTALASGQGH